MKRKLENMWDSTFERFEHEHPGFAENIVEWYPSGYRELTFRMKDGTRRTYNWFTGRICAVFGENDYEFKELTDEEIRRKFARTLTSKMEDMPIFQEDLATLTGISRVTISDYCRGKALPNYINLRKLSHALKCSPTELYVYK